ncbi:Lys-63-specific deubiquitinase BRCC36-like protein [Drosera capensis]
MALSVVKMTEEVWWTCLTHSLSTETEESMGLLLGDIQYSKSGNHKALIWGAAPQTRSDRRKDRVETNPEQVAAASALAEMMTIATGKTTRVIGWYHSHPHITVLPSHVDVRTQAMYQLLDSGFIGLIFSCFNQDANKVGRIQVIAFQSLDGKQSYVSIPVSVAPSHKGTIVDMASSPSDDASLGFGSGKSDRTELDTGDSRALVQVGKQSADLGGLFAHADASYQGIEKSGINSYLENHSDDLVDLDPMDLSDGMQEAMHRSNLDISGAEYTRKEIPLQVVPSSALLKLDSPLASYMDLQNMLFDEEKAAYGQAILQSSRDGKVHPIAFLHHTSTYQASLCKLMEYCLTPAIDVLENQLRQNKLRLALLDEEAKVLESELNRGSSEAVAARSPRREDVVQGSPSRVNTQVQSLSPKKPVIHNRSKRAAH